MPTDSQKISFFLMTNSNLTFKVLVKANITWVSEKLVINGSKCAKITLEENNILVSLKRLKKKEY